MRRQGNVPKGQKVGQKPGLQSSVLRYWESMPYKATENNIKHVSIVVKFPETWNYETNRAPETERSQLDWIANQKLYPLSFLLSWDSPFSSDLLKKICELSSSLILWKTLRFPNNRNCFILPVEDIGFILTKISTSLLAHYVTLILS